MKKRLTVPFAHLPTRLPMVGTLTWYLFLSHLNAPGWVWGVAGVILTTGWVVALVDMFNREDIDVTGWRKSGHG